MNHPRTAPFAAVRLADVAQLAEVDPGSPYIADCAFHLVRRHFDIQAFGVNGVTGNAGDVMIIEHHESDDAENRTNGQEELFAVMTGHAVFTVGGEELDAPAGTLVFVRDQALLRFARATADGTAILAIGGRPGAPFELSPWEKELPSP
jgi:mannose-6-phosphate isomerase-like protein (cupin superfamily)